MQNNRLLILICFLLCLQSSSFQAAAQETISKENWEEALKDIDYGSRKVKEKEVKEEVIEDGTKEKNNFDPSSFLNLSIFGLSLAKVLAVLLFLALLVFLVYLIISLFLNRDVKFSKINFSDSEMNMVLEDLEENLHESDLEKALRLALEAGNYKAAIRIYYLAVIKDMSLKGLITWKKDKTNYTYVNELFETKWHKDFSTVTLAFERIWYGNIDVDKVSYDQLTPGFQSLLNKIRANE
ncbi:MAG: hypothetical protein ACPGWM_06785 [Flavobacteriales bacterium]